MAPNLKHIEPHLTHIFQFLNRMATDPDISEDCVRGCVIYILVWYGMVWYGMVWDGMVWYGMVFYGMVWYDMAWYGMVW